MKEVVVKKAWVLDSYWIKDEWNWDFEHFIVYNDNLHKAEDLILNILRNDLFEDLRSNLDHEITKENIEIKRLSNMDKRLFEDVWRTESEINEILYLRDRNDKYQSILDNNCITHCYIKKRGQYYRPNSSGYTDYRIKAGIYLKAEAIQDGYSHRELLIVPIDNDEHNSYLNEHIEDLKTRLVDRQNINSFRKVTLAFSLAMTKHENNPLAFWKETDKNFKKHYKDFDSITFSNGYATNRPQFEIELKGISIKEGRPEWGAVKGEKYFVLELGEIIEKPNCRLGYENDEDCITASCYSCRYND